MALNIGELCRLCAKKGDFMKDLKDSNNLATLHLIKDLMQISITETDELPTIVCLNCEEKMVSFQLFMLECYKTQDSLKDMYFQNLNLKEEFDDFESHHEFKSEVKNELETEDLLIERENLEVGGIQFKNDDFDDDIGYDNQPGSDDDEVTLATLKLEKKKYKPKDKKQYKKKINGYENIKQDGQESKIKINEFIKFECTICHKIYSSWYKLSAHTHKCHRIAPMVNCKCGVSLKSKSVAYKHVKDHQNPNMFSCDMCPKIAYSLESLKKHKLRHVPKSERKFPCPVCNKQFSLKESLKSHQKSHIPIAERKMYACDMCDAKFTTRSSAISHKRVVHDRIKSYVCDLCGYACGTNGELRQHRAIHSDDKPHVCKTCGKSFKTHANLKTHMDIHEDTSYQCPVCKRILNSRRTLRKHLLVHEDNCRHVCSFCRKAFKRRQTLKVHLYTHTGDKPLSCKWCDEKFSYASTLRSHRLRCHPDKMAAQLQGNTYQSYAPAQIDQTNMPVTLAVQNITLEYTKLERTNIMKNENEVM